MKPTKSLSVRIITYSAFWVITALAVVAGLLNYFYQDHVLSHYDAHVDMHMEELIGASGFMADGSFSLAFLPSDPRYNELHSGWYWEVRQQDKSLMRSPSLGNASLDIGGIDAWPETAIYETTGPVNDLIRLHVASPQRLAGFEPLVFLSSAPSADYEDDIANYSYHIISSLVMLGIGLLMIVVLQVRLALKPLNSIGKEISGIREGNLHNLSGNYPSDVQPLADELNNLLDHNVVLLKRARNQLGDLAHSVKNPLTVINNETRNMRPERRALIQRQTRDIIENIDRYLSRARTSGNEKVLGARTEIRKVVDDLVYTMEKLYKDRALQYDSSGLKDCTFRGEDQDLEEMLGNLIDNASKWAETRVVIHDTCCDRFLTLTVEDDGPGIPDDEIEKVKSRGVKLDCAKPGHGQGLGIVNDIAELYGGKLELCRSELGGLQANLILPKG